MGDYARAWKRAAKRWKFIRNSERQMQIDDYLRNRPKYKRLLRVALAAYALSDEIAEFNGPVNGTDELDRALLGVYGHGEQWTEIRGRLQAELQALESVKA